MKSIVLIFVIAGFAATQQAPKVIRPDGAIPERFIHHRVDLSECLDIHFTNPKDFRVDSDNYERTVEIHIYRPGIADCTMEGK